MTVILAVPFITICLQRRGKSPTLLISLQTDIPIIICAELKVNKDDFINRCADIITIFRFTLKQFSLVR